VRLVVLSACGEVSVDADGKRLWAGFEAFLGRPPVVALIEAIVGSTSLRWAQWATSRSSDIDAVLTPGSTDDAIASARLELPDGSHRFGRDARCATLVLHFEPTRLSSSPRLPVPPDVWEERLALALELPRALSELLSGDLGLAVSGDPPVQVVARLEAQKDLAEMIDIAGMTQLPGRPNGVQAVGYFIAGADGVPAVDAATQMMTHVLRYALSITR